LIFGFTPLLCGYADEHRRDQRPQIALAVSYPFHPRPLGRFVTLDFFPQSPFRGFLDQSRVGSVLTHRNSSFRLSTEYSLLMTQLFRSVSELSTVFCSKGVRVSISSSFPDDVFQRSCRSLRTSPPPPRPKKTVREQAPFSLRITPRGHQQTELPFLAPLPRLILPASWLLLKQSTAHGLLREFLILRCCC